MIWLKIGTFLACMVLFWWGGYNWHNARRFVMPFICTLMAFLGTNDALAGVGSLLAIGPLTMGYGDKSPLRHVFGDGWGRGVWGLLVASCLSLPLFLTHHLGIGCVFALPMHQSWPLIVLCVYLTLNFTLENVLKRLPQCIGDPIIGAGFGSIVFFIV